MKRTPMVYSKQNHIILTQKIKDFFDEILSTEETLILFQDLVDTGLAWQLGEDVQHLATALIRQKSIDSPPSGYSGIEPLSLYKAMIQKKYAL